jgi:hypothetical protein
MIYEAFFIDCGLRASLEKDILYKHITTEFKPAITHEHLYGEPAWFKVVGYGCDGNNEAYKVEMVHCDNDELKALYEQIDIPHITISTSATGKPVNSRYLEFKEIYPESKMLIKTTFGGFDGKIKTWKGEP